MKNLNRCHFGCCNSTIHTDTFVQDDYNISIRANLSSIQYTDAYQKQRLDRLYARDYEELKTEIMSKSYGISKQQSLKNFCK